MLILLAFGWWGMLAQNAITGMVKNEENQPLEGAHVWIKELRRGAITNNRGEFSLENLPSQGVVHLQISFLGFKTEKLTVDLSKPEPVFVSLKEQSIMGQEIIISATRAKETTPTSHVTLTSEKIRQQNSGQEIPMLLQIAPSLVATSDAGNGVGYSTFRIRGTDQSRINVMVNDIPLNDAESHGVFWVNMPDFSESVNIVQIQRGVGTSGNGAAAFGASVNLSTNNLEEDAYAEVNNAFGTFNSHKHTVKASTGLLSNNTAFDVRLSQIKSDGFIDRAFSDLKSFYFSGGYYSDKHVLRTNIFWGKEITYQAWEGVPKVKLLNDTARMRQFAQDAGYSDEETENLFNSNPRTFNRYLYHNQTDNYKQNHYQIFYTYTPNQSLKTNLALHYTQGFGYYESYRYNKKLSSFGLPNINIGDTIIKRTDLINRKFLDNDFYGIVASVINKLEKLETTFGGGLNRYDGHHFGTIIWSKFNNGTIIPDHEYYRNRGIKDDGNVYLRSTFKITESLSFYGDLQWRGIHYKIDGVDDDNRNVTQEHRYSFFNPKAGLFYVRESLSAFFSFAQAHREPTRSNFTDADPTRGVPKYERLNDFETGIQYKTSKGHLSLNGYFMHYNDQLVLTGNINDVGSPIMENVKDSYRLGVEMLFSVKILQNLQWTANTTLSKNKIRNFVAYFDDWDTWSQRVDTLKEIDIAFSPSVIAGSQMEWEPLKGFSMILSDNFVGKQFIDNTSNNNRALDPYWVSNLRLNYRYRISTAVAHVYFQINNLYNREYCSNAWVYTYFSNNEERMLDGYFPQAGRHFMIGLNVRF